MIYQVFTECESGEHTRCPFHRENTTAGIVEEYECECVCHSDSLPAVMEELERKISEAKAWVRGYVGA